MQRSSGNAERHAHDFADLIQVIADLEQVTPERHDFADRSAERPDADFAEFIASRIRKVICDADAFLERNASTHPFFHRLPATELTGPEVDLFNSLISVAESVHATLPRCVSLQEWATRRIPKDCPGLPIIYRSQPKSVCGAVQPASVSTSALLAYAIPETLLVLIVRYVGAHNLETFWTCSKCNPYWYNWYCRGCKRVNKYQHWTPRLHYGHERTGSGLTVRQSCGCCRSQHRDSFPCEACDDLWELKGTCHTMQDLVKTYNGT